MFRTRDVDEKVGFVFFFFFFCGNTGGKIAIRVLVVIYLGSAEFLRDSNIF